jgi:hypothetical protein
MRFFGFSALVGAIVWSALLWTSIDAAMALKARQIPGYPNPAQLAVFVGIPATLLLLTLLAPVLANRIGQRAGDYVCDWSRWVAPVPFICLLLAFPYLLLLAI